MLYICTIQGDIFKITSHVICVMHISPNFWFFNLRNYNLEVFETIRVRANLHENYILTGLKYVQAKRAAPVANHKNTIHTYNLINTLVQEV